MNDNTKFLVLIITAVILICGLAYFIATRVLDPARCTSNTYACRDTQVEQCMRSEKYTRAECITLVGR